MRPSRTGTARYRRPKPIVWGYGGIERVTDLGPVPAEDALGRHRTRVVSATTTGRPGCVLFSSSQTLAVSPRYGSSHNAPISSTLRRSPVCRGRHCRPPNYAGGVGKDAGEPEANSRPGPNGDSAFVELVVQGMHCQSCAALIEETLVRDPRVRTATVDLDRARASVVFDASALSIDELCAAVTSVGYQATPVASGEQTA